MYDKDKRRKRRIYDRKYKKKLKRMNRYSGAVYEVDGEKHMGHCQSRTVTKPFYRRIYRGKISPYCKKQTNRIVRKYKGEIPKGCGYRKLFDMWYEMD